MGYGDEGTWKDMGAEVEPGDGRKVWGRGGAWGWRKDMGQRWGMGMEEG